MTFLSGCSLATPEPKDPKPVVHKDIKYLECPKDRSVKVVKYDKIYYKIKVQEFESIIKDLKVCKKYNEFLNWELRELDKGRK